MEKGGERVEKGSGVKITQKMNMNIYFYLFGFVCVFFGLMTGTSCYCFQDATNRVKKEQWALLTKYLVEKGIPREYISGHVDDDGFIMLSLSDSPLSDLNILHGIPIRELTISETHVTDLSPLSHCTTLRELTMARLKIFDLSPLSHLPLEHLQISSTDVRDLSPITNMPLRLLWITNTAITNLEIIAQTDITHLVFSPNKYPKEQIEKLRSSKIEVFNAKDRDLFWQLWDKGIWSGQCTIEEIKQIFDELGIDYSPRFPLRFEKD